MSRTCSIFSRIFTFPSVWPDQGYIAHPIQHSLLHRWSGEELCIPQLGLGSRDSKLGRLIRRAVFADPIHPSIPAYFQAWII